LAFYTQADFDANPIRVRFDWPLKQTGFT
jgi:hypothetical protein